MVDTVALGAIARKGVQVQVLSSVFINSQQLPHYNTYHKDLAKFFLLH